MNARQGTQEGEREGVRDVKKLSSVPATSAFFHKFAISLKGQYKLVLLTNELSGQDMKFQ